MKKNGKIVWSTQKKKVVDLLPSKYNPRKATEKQTKDLEISLDRFNLAAPVIINKNNHVIGGHFRLRILKKKGIKEVDVRTPSRLLGPKEEKELNLRLNRNLGDWDWSLLTDFDKSFLENAGFSKDEMLINFGLNEIEAEDIDLDRRTALVVEMPGAVRLKSRQVFYCADEKEFKKIKRFFATDREGFLDKKKLLKLIR